MNLEKTCQLPGKLVVAVNATINCSVTCAMTKALWDMKFQLTYGLSNNDYRVAMFSTGSIMQRGVFNTPL